MKLDHFVAHRLVPFCREQLMSNIVREWCKLSNSLCPTRVFTIDNRVWRSNGGGGGGGVINAKSLHQNDIETATNYYSNGIAQWIGDRSTFGIVHRYSVEKNRSSAEGRGQFPWLTESPFYDGISLVLCSAKEETLQLQTALTRQRHHWYRRLSKSPLNSGFKLSMVEEEGSKSSNRINIVYQPKQLQVDGGDIQLDSIILNNSTQEDKGSSTATAAAAIAGDGRRDIIICRSNLDNVLGAFLDDAYTSVEDGGGQSEQIILKLNPSLVPFKLAFTFDEAGEQLSSSVCSRLNELTNYLISNLQDYSDISVFPFVGSLESGTDNSQLLTPSQSDALAVQYCAILKAETLENGLIWLRNRDTRISETIHLSNFVKTMLFYLQPERLINGGTAAEQQQQQSSANAAE